MNADGVNCNMKVEVNDDTVWLVQDRDCPPKFEEKLDVYMSGDDDRKDDRPMDGQIRNFNFFTHEI